MMKKVKIMAICLLSAGFAYAVDFKIQADIDDPAKWEKISVDDPGVFYGDFSISTTATGMKLSTAAVLKSDDVDIQRTLTSVTGRFFDYSDSTNTVLTLNNIIFKDGNCNLGGTGGGAICFCGTGAVIDGNVSFEHNSSLNMGAAVFSSGTLILNGDISFKKNICVNGYAGAVYSGSNITTSSSGRLEVIANSSSLSGGGIYAGGYVSIEGAAVISGNSSILESGGGICAVGNISFTAVSEIIEVSSNSSRKCGGALFSSGTITFAGGAIIKQNQNLVKYTGVFCNGGAIYAAKNIVFSSTFATIELLKNTASEGGGAIYANEDIVFRNKVIISSNVAYSGNGGAIYSSSGTVIFDSFIRAENNKAYRKGGVIFSEGIVINNGGYFSGNKSEYGGAIYIYGSTSSISALTEDVLFINNKMNDTRNDIYMYVDSAGVSSNTLTLNASKSRTIIFDGGIICNGKRNFINKTGLGELVFNGDFDLQNFNLSSGSLSFGATSNFCASNVIFATGTFVSMRNSIPKVLNISTLTSSALIYYGLNLYDNSSDKIITNVSNMDSTIIKIGILGIDPNEQTFNIISSSLTSVGKVYIDNTNFEGSTMTRVHINIVYDGGAGSSAAWKKVDLEIQVDQLNAIKNLTNNEYQVALLFDKVYGTSSKDLFYIIDSIDKIQNPLEKKSALLDLSGHIYANAITFPALSVPAKNIFYRLERNFFTYDNVLYKNNIWVQYNTVDNLYKGDGNSFGNFKTLSKSIQTGIDTLKSDTQIFGVTFGVNDVKLKQNQDTIDLTEYNIGGYGAYFFDNNLEMKFIVAGGRQNYSSTRNIKYLNRKAASEFIGYSLNASAKLYYNYYFGNNFCMKPFTGLEHARVVINDFTENGADSANLTVIAGSYNRADADLGLQISNGMHGKLKWYAEIKIDALFVGRAGEVTGKFICTDQTVNIKGIENDTLNGVFCAGVFYDLSKRLSVYVNMNSLVSRTQTNYYANAGINLKFATASNDF